MILGSAVAITDVSRLASITAIINDPSTSQRRAVVKPGTPESRAMSVTVLVSCSRQLDGAGETHTLFPNERLAPAH